MPKELTHWILADRALAGLDNNSHLKQLIQKYHNFYLGGAILPDTPQYLNKGPYNTTGLAKHFHDNGGNSYDPLIMAERRSLSVLKPETFVCLLGVITHMQADIVFHPFVYALSGTSDIGRHYKLESDIDIYFLKNGARPTVRHVADLVSSGTRATLIDTCVQLFDPEDRLPRQALEYALNLHCRYQVLYDQTFWKLLVIFLAKLVGAPFKEQRYLFYPLAGLHEDHFDRIETEWQHPVTGKHQQTTLEQLANVVIQRITTLFERIELAGSLETVLYDYPGENLLTGVNGVCLTQCKQALRT